MGRKPTVLFVFFEGLADTVIDSQVLAHVRAMGELGVADIEIYAFAWNDDSYARSMRQRERAERLAHATVHVVRGHRPGLPFSAFLNGRILERAAQASSRTFTHIHARTDYSVLAATRLARSSGASLIWDCRGDALAELSFRTDAARGLARIVIPIRQAVVRRRIVRAARLADRAIFVSRALKERMGEWWGDKACEIIPGAASSELFFYDSALRIRVRRDLGIEDRQRVYIYVGSLAPYQEFPETVKLFDTIAAADSPALFLVVTRDTEEAKRVLGDRRNAILKSATIEDVNAYLNAADAAFMLRKRAPTNTVAFPTKFAEYGLAGLAVVMTDAVRDAYAMAKEFGNLIDAEDLKDRARIPELDRPAVMRAYQARVTKKAQASAYRRIYG